MITSFLREWILQIVSMFVFVSLLEIVLPNGQMKKYIDMIIGLLIIIVIINPFINLIFKDIDIERNILTLPEINDSTQENSDILELQQDQMKSVYAFRVQEDIMKIIEEKTNYNVLNAEVETIDELEDEDFGMVTKVYLYVDEKQDLQSDDKQGVNIKSIENINVNLSTNQNNEDECSDFSNIKKIIGEKYGVADDNIYISLSRKMEGE